MTEPRRLVNPDEVSPVALAAMLGALPLDHPLIVAARLGVEVAESRAAAPGWWDDYAGGRYHRHNPLPEYSELQRRRYPPTGDRDLWVKYGPAGPPADLRAVAA